MRRCGLPVSTTSAAELRENQVYVSQDEPRIVERRSRMTDLKSKTVGGVVWSVARAGWSSAVTLVLFIVLARVLEPKDFGLFALASILVEVGRVVSSGGLGDAVIRAQEPDDRFLSTVFWLNLALSLGFALLIALAAPIYASFFDNRDSVFLIYALALTLPLGSLGAVHGALLAREFRYSQLTLQAMLSSISSGLVAVTLALQGYGVWSLVAQALITAIVTLVFAWIVIRWRPSFQFDTSVVKSIAAFGASLAVTQLVWMMLVRVQDLFIGSFYGPAAVGIYRIAWRVIELIANMLLGPVSSVSLVTFSRLQSEPERLRYAYGQLISYASLLVFPMVLGFSATAPLLIPLIFGAEWADAVPVTQVLSLMVIPFVFNFFCGPALTASNYAGAVLKVALVQLLVTILFTWIAVRFGLVAVSAAYVLRAYVTMPLQQHMLARHLGIRMRDTWTALTLPLGCALTMAVSVHFSLRWFETQYAGGWTPALLSVGLGALVYTVLVVVLAWAKLRDMATTLLSIRRKRESAE